jgi:hypothetical protein
VIAAIRRRALRPGEDDAIITVATDGAALYPSERAKTLARRFGGSFDEVDAADVFGRHIAGATTDHMIDCTARDRARVFNLGYYTWVEQQGTPFDVFESRRTPAFWTGLRPYLARWDELIAAFNARARAS